MCNVAGYVGDRPTATILLEMMERQQGFAGGYYTGIATIADGRLYHAKVVGDVATLRRETDAEELPGTVGIAHSRSKGGGGLEWAHPFVDNAGDMAYLANGDIGYFEKDWNANAIAGRLFSKGCDFRSRMAESVGSYRAVLPDGTCVHASEVMCHYIASLIEVRGGPAAAMCRAFETFPAEIVGLMVRADVPDCVFASRVNRPLMLGRDARGSYLASTAMAFPEGDLPWVNPMPANATAVVGRDSVEILPFASPPVKVIDFFPWDEARECALELLADGRGKGLGEFKRATASLWSTEGLPQQDMVIYEILRKLQSEGRVRFVDVPMDGVVEGISTMKKRTVLN